VAIPTGSISGRRGGRGIAVGITAFLTVGFAADHAGGEIGAARVASGLSLPVFVTAPAGDSRLFIVGHGGLIRILDDGELLPTPFLDLTDELEGEAGAFDERGLLGLAFSPDYPVTGLLYVNYTTLADDRTVVARYRVSANPNVVDEATEEILLEIPQPTQVHNGGHLAFGSDGLLYIGLGDGGPQLDPQNNAQRDGTLLGKMLRIDVSGGLGSGYTVPLTNPFVRKDPLDEIWARGFRNPYRFSFDRLTGDLYIGDVGLSTIEEVDVQPAYSPGGENYGWRIMEGSSCLGLDPCDSIGLTLPVYEYTHGGRPGASSGTERPGPHRFRTERPSWIRTSAS
jgi:glucose/arabinose dehydrogenase